MEKSGNQPDCFSSVQLIFLRSIRAYLLTKLFFLTFFLLGSYSASSQNRTLDSLQALVKVTTNDTLKANLFNQISKQYLYDFNNLEKMKQYAAQAIHLSQPHNHKKGLAYGYIYFGIYYYNQANYDYALNYYTKSLKLLEELNDLKGMGSAYLNIGSIYGSRGDYNKALTFMLKAVKFKEEAKDERGTSAAYNNIGNMYADQGKYPEALNYHMKSLRIKEHINDKIGISMAYNNIGSLFQSQGKTDVAIDYQFKSLRIKEELDDQLGVSVAYTNIASLYVEIKKYAEALQYNFKALKIKQQLKDKAGEALCYSSIGTAYTAQKNTTSTVKHGMDASIISIDKTTMQVEFAGAHNSLYYVRSGELHEIKADKNSIGTFSKDGEDIIFNNTVIPIEKGDIFYLFSDGYPDQIGGPNRKKFYYKPFKELLVSIHHLPMDEQRDILDKTITEWRGERDQTDDILVIGIKIA